MSQSLQEQLATVNDQILENNFKLSYLLQELREFGPTDETKELWAECTRESEELAALRARILERINQGGAN
jgi:hypothetical protein